MKTNELFMKIIIIILTTVALGKHARSKNGFRKKGSCKPLSNDFKEGFLFYYPVLPRLTAVIGDGT